MLVVVVNVVVVIDNVDVVQLLIENGANIEANDMHHGRPLHAAAVKGHVRSARLLLQAGKHTGSVFSDASLDFFDES